VIVRVDALPMVLEARRVVVAGAAGGEPAPRPPASGFAARTLAELPDQVGFWHRDDVAVLAARYERLRG
jgi:hypothetical protein